MRILLAALLAFSFVVVSIAQTTAPTTLPTTAPTTAPVATPPVVAKPPETQPTTRPAEPEKLDAGQIGGLRWRSIGPGTTGGRIGDIAIHPHDKSTWYIAVASGGVWKTKNAGTTWSPIFDGEKSYSIGCLALDLKDPLTLWVGTGENNSQRSVSYGDGVYKTTDGGRSFKHMGLPNSEHIGRIAIDPRDSNVVYVAAMGPLWSDGGDRGLYKTVDGGKTWTKSLDISERTGVSEVVIDSYSPDTLYAVAYQRRRHVWTLLDGGPESGLYKSTDAGATWKKLSNGLPTGDVGRIGIAVSPVHTNVLYAIVEATAKNGGFFRSTDYGQSFEKRSDYVSNSPQYYQEIFCHPKDVDRVYSMDVMTKVSEDGGKTFRNVGEDSKHVDNHALWIDPDDTRHLLSGCDGGLYESFDDGASWRFFSNLPITQFYRVSVDNAVPFYNVYGGTQDNFSLGAPARTRNASGIVNSDWFVTLGGDGFESAIDPVDPTIVYAQLQHGVLVRYDKKTGEKIDIQPQPLPGEPGLRWNWNAALLISPHAPTRLYFGAQRLFRSDNRGDDWTPVSPDLSRQLDRNALKVMGRTWSVDAVAKNMSTSIYGNIVSLDESPKVEGLLYVGTDDGLLQTSEDGGKTWRKTESFPGVPDLTYVSCIHASRHDPNTVYVAFDNHKMGDFKPYVLKSADRGKTFTSIVGDLPVRGEVHALIEDHVRPGLIFAGTEFGCYVTVDEGAHWIPLKAGLPPIAVRDIDIQRRENDLAIATFGRGYYILDDYTPLRHLGPQKPKEEFMIFPVKDAPWYVQAQPLGGAGKSFQGESFFTAPNPPYGAVFTYWFRDELKTRKKKRQEAEAKLAKDGGEIKHPSADELKAEEREEAPSLVFVIADGEGKPIRELTRGANSGMGRVVWDLRGTSMAPAGAPAAEDEEGGGGGGGRGPLVLPGTYSVRGYKRIDGVMTPLSDPVTFQVKPIEPLTTGAITTPEVRQAVIAYRAEAARLQRLLTGAVRAADEARKSVDAIEEAAKALPAQAPKIREDARALEKELRDLQETMSGDAAARARQEPVPPALVDRLQRAMNAQSSTLPPTGTHRQALRAVAAQIDEILKRLADLKARTTKLETDADVAGLPWTIGRVPR